MKIFYTIVLVICSVPVFSQNIEDYLSRCQYQQAIDYLEQQNDTSRVAEMQKVLCYNSLQNYPKAIDILLNLQEKYPEDPQIKIQLALGYNNLSMVPESIKYFGELIKMDSANIYFLKQMAFCLEKTNQMDSAKVYFNRILEIDPTDQKAKEELIKIEINLENYAEALDITDRFLVGDTNNIQLNILRALGYYYMDNYKVAIESFEKCRLLGDTSLTVNKYLGVSYFYSNQNKKAYPFLVKAYEQDSTNNSVLYALATVNKDLENFPEAIRLYTQLIRKAVPPDIALYSYYKSLADSYNDNKEVEPAIYFYKKALNYYTNYQDMELLFIIADLYDLHVHDYGLAVDYYKQYRESLTRYGEFLAKQDSENQDNANQAITTSISDKIKYLDERITYLEDKIEKSNLEKNDNNAK